MSYDVPVAPGEKAEIEETTELSGESWPMWEGACSSARATTLVTNASVKANVISILR